MSDKRKACFFTSILLASLTAQILDTTFFESFLLGALFALPAYYLAKVWEKPYVSLVYSTNKEEE